MRDRVLHLRSSRGLWGPENQILLLARYLPAEGFEAGVLALYRPLSATPIHPFVAAARQVGVAAEQVADPWLSQQVIRTVAGHLREGQFRLLHTHGYKADLVGLLATRRAGVRWVVTSHGLYLENTRLRLYDFLDRLAMRRADAIIAVSESEQRRLLSLGLSPSQILKIHNAIDVAAFSESVDGMLDTPGEWIGLTSRQVTSQKPRHSQRLILFAGRLNPQKGLIYLLESICQVVETAPDVRLLIAGDGPLRDELEQHARRLSLAEVVSFLGFRADVAALMRTADVFVLPSVEEPFGIVLLEALALARPVVATAVGGIPEVITHGETGLLVPPRDPAALAEAILWLLNNPTEAARLGEQGRERVRRDFSATEMARRTAEVYRRVLAMRA